jgi:outer membrane receptor protein involved in Fe transport
VRRFFMPIVALLPALGLAFTASAAAASAQAPARESVSTRAAASVTSGATTGSVSAFPDDEITMLDGTGTYALAQPGGLFSGGTTFKDAWRNSY